ncbi:DUF2383 domain-containing protein [Geomesophilobacter sediminis]|uniref:Ferritin-like domain-containing protein n=1 Tax=Geomesophilobacter sediminis TaxID=2798584 RepID=A0A8J7LY07_9BACT|nr:DUF2383 domain-containing protein [Geomesophilobacter sediminis]MBJ6724051.1 ferritin-like domain-containing protein [Geomesophilobacter sediminis]
MDRQEIIDRLNDLIQLDADAVVAYDHAIRNVKYDDIRTKLTEFQEDHRQHIQTLTVQVQRLDGRPVKTTPDLKGYLQEGLTALRSITGTEGALLAMQTNEKQTNKKYAEAHELDFPQEIKSIITVNLSDEQRHLSYIQEILDTPRREL